MQLIADIYARYGYDGYGRLASTLTRSPLRSQRAQADWKAYRSFFASGMGQLLVRDWTRDTLFGAMQVKRTNIDQPRTTRPATLCFGRGNSAMDRGGSSYTPVWPELTNSVAIANLGPATEHQEILTHENPADG